MSEPDPRIIPELLLMGYVTEDSGDDTLYYKYGDLWIFELHSDGRSYITGMADELLGRATTTFAIRRSKKRLIGMAIRIINNARKNNE